MFSTLGEDQILKTDQEKTMNNARVGFAIASPSLVLGRSKREILFNFSFTTDSIKYLSKKLNLEVGWSDHTKNPMLINEIIDNFNVKTIEMHIDLDGKGFEANKGHCWMPNDLSLLKDFLSNKKKMYGNYKKNFSKAETIERLHRSDPSDGLRPLKRARKIRTWNIWLLVMQDSSVRHYPIC